ncbi:MAG: hypothetical protein H0T79_13720 [Deltaproteobacteria bacterium]|nr:hypothetical protein [Deltaproteobacteria bacterium]
MPTVIVVSSILSVIAVASVYYYLLTSGTGSGNSQDYPTSSPILNFLRLLIRREVINLASFFACLLGLVDLLYVGLVAGSIVSSSILVVQQVGRYREARVKRAAVGGPASSAVDG